MHIAVNADISPHWGDLLKSVEIFPDFVKKKTTIMDIYMIAYVCL